MRSQFFFITYVAGNLGLIFYGVMALLMPSLLLEPFTLHVYQFPKDATVATTYLAALFRFLGFLNVILGLFGLLLLRRYRIDRQTWILRLVIVLSLLAYIGPIVFDNTVGTIGFFEIVEHLLFVLMVLSGAMMLRTRNAIEPDPQDPGQ
ncbi:MAG TPA: hypothetical protein VLY63_12980 [Anaerolineae bacterium]|nr:hypothetical protein [Anaerolineae bacterium]